MSAMFTQHAYDRMRERGIRSDNVHGLLEAIERVAADPSELARSKDVLRIKQEKGKDAFILRAGDIRAVVTVDPADPERIIVVSVYRADKGKPTGNFVPVSGSAHLASL